jgi:hypothetical protein
MNPTPRRRSAIACLLTAVLFLCLALPTLAAAPSSEAPTFGLDRLLSWALDLVEGRSDRVHANDQAAPLIDPDGIAFDNPVQQLSNPDDTPPDDEGEAAPLIDPNG